MLELTFINILCWTNCQAPAVQLASLSHHLHCLATHWSLNWMKLTRLTEAVIALCHDIPASWLLTSRTLSTSRWKRTTCGAKESTSDQSNEASFQPLTPLISAYSTTVCSQSFTHTCYFVNIETYLFCDTQKINKPMKYSKQSAVT